MNRKLTKVYFVINITITIALCLFAVLLCQNNILRCISSIRDLGVSIAYYFCEFFIIFTNKTNPITLTVTQLPNVDVDVLFPQTYAEFTHTFELFKEKIFDENNFRAWLAHLSVILSDISIWIMFLLPLVLAFVLLFKIAFSGQNNNYDQKSKQLIKWLRFEDKTLKPAKRFVQGFVQYLDEHYGWVQFWTLASLVALNVTTMFFEFIAYMLYFAVSVDIVSLYTQVYKLVVDLYLMFGSLSTETWIFIGYLLLLRWRRQHALTKLRHFEMRNKGYANSLGICTMFTGNMGVGKTKLMTDVSLSLSTVYKYNAKNILLKIERWFPEFPWATLQYSLRQAIWDHQIYSLTTCEQFTAKKLQRYTKNPHDDKLYGYDVARYGLTYNDGLQIINFFSALDDYVKAFFIFYLPKSLMLGNYSIREDGKLQDIGNLPMWDYDFFTREPTNEYDDSYFANILDFDVLRRGKTMNADNPLADTFEFGIVTITELDKERGNTFDNKELKKMCAEANQKNDLFNYSPKMGRHPATVLYNPFINFLFDQQRPSKTEADLREVCDKIVNIEDVSKQHLSMPFFWIEEILFAIFEPIYKRTYEDYRFNRADNSLSIYFLKNTLGRFVNWYEKIYNLYGFDVYKLASDNGKLEGNNVKVDKYFLMYKKALSNRYSTDCYREFFRAKSRQKSIGIIDYTTFEGVKATTDELKSMNSYFIRDMDKAFIDEVKNTNEE